MGSVPREQGLGATFCDLQGTWGFLEELQTGLGGGVYGLLTEVTPEETGSGARPGHRPLP